MDTIALKLEKCRKYFKLMKKFKAQKTLFIKPDYLSDDYPNYYADTLDYLTTRPEDLKKTYQSLAERNFFIKAGYQINAQPQYYLDTPIYLTYQPDVYALALHFANCAQVKYIIDIGSGNGLKLQPFLQDFQIICIDFGGNQELLQQNVPGVKFIEANLEQGLPALDSDILKDSIIIMSDVIEHIINPHAVLAGLSDLSHQCQYMLLSTPDRVRCRGIENNGPPGNPCHVREWNLEEFHHLMQYYKFRDCMLGYTVNTDYHLDKSTILAISGTHVYQPVERQVSVLAVVNVFNEYDIIPQTINHLLDQGVDIHLVDNWSTDTSYEIMLALQSQHPERITLERFPDQAAEYYEWDGLLKHTETLAANSTYDWIIHYDADEIRQSPWPGVTLRQAISFIDSLGFNALDFTVLDFRPIVRDEVMPPGYIHDKIVHFEFADQPWHFEQIKAWKNITGVTVDLASSGGHKTDFPNRKIYPMKFLLRHYSLRSQCQAQTKIFKDRKPRFSPQERQEKGWHVHYDQCQPTDSFIWNPNKLLKWNPDQFNNEYLVERISGIGVVRPKL